MENVSFDLEQAFKDICEMAMDEMVNTKEAYDDLVDEYIYQQIHDGIFNENMDTEKIAEDLKSRWNDCLNRFNVEGEKEDVLASREHVPTDLNSQLPKLIRDNVPTILEEHKRKIKYRVISGNEYDRELRKKLIEETSELLDSDNEEELQDQLSDVFELMETYIAYKQFDIQNIKEHQKRKRDERGGYQKGILLTEVENE